jgi:tRNA uridine 5-carboxymethylaminomethyl modification enzyme
MIDDLTRLGLDEPYRLFTSRAEHRLLLGVDTVLPRLVPHGRRLGLVSAEEHDEAMSSDRRVEAALSSLRAARVNPSESERERVRLAAGIGLDAPTTLFQILQRPDVVAEEATRLAPEIFAGLTREERSIVFSKVRYDGYIRRERERLERLRPFEARRIPDGFRYEGVPGLSREVVEKCGARRPRTVGEAARIPGVTPAAVAVISAHVARLAPRDAKRS